MEGSSLSQPDRRRSVNASLNDQLGSASSSGYKRSPTRNGSNRDKTSELDSMSSRRDENGKSIPAWKLREQMKNTTSQHVSTSMSHSSRTIKPVSRTPGSLSANRTFKNSSPGHGGGLGGTRHGGGVGGGGDVDPSLPPAFRAAFARQQQRKRNGGDGDDFMSLDSVHSGKSGTYMTGTPTTGHDSDGSCNSLGSESLDGHDSFASLGEDSDDDEAYRESKNLLARQEIEQNRKTKSNSNGSGKSRIKRAATGVHGTPLGFIAE